MSVVTLLVTGLGLGVLAVIAAIALVAAIVSLAGWVVRCSFAVERLRKARFARILAEGRALGRIAQHAETRNADSTVG